MVEERPTPGNAHEPRVDDAVAAIRRKAAELRRDAAAQRAEARKLRDAIDDILEATTRGGFLGTTEPRHASGTDASSPAKTSGDGSESERERLADLHAAEADARERIADHEDTTKGRGEPPPHST
jgi:hypothetical protein